MPAFLKTITLNTAHLDEMVKFFSSLGISVQEGQVDKGSKTFTAQLGDVRICLISIQRGEKPNIPNLSLSIQVGNIEESIKKLKTQTSVQILMDLQEVSSGKVAIVIDPDGRSFELFS